MNGERTASSTPEHPLATVLVTVLAIVLAIDRGQASGIAEPAARSDWEERPRFAGWMADGRGESARDDHREESEAAG